MSLFVTPNSNNHIGDEAIEPDSAYWYTDENMLKQ
jgi:hypothetical protein